ncbi:MAG: extracellular solute-binding protein [Rhodothermales bacterium]|nr:extracellular solute-binding protein [Rhodothermales bacterium]
MSSGFHRGIILACTLLVAGCASAPDVPRIRIWHQKIGPERLFFERVVAQYNADNTDHVVEVLYRETEEARNLFVIASVGGKGPELLFGPSDNVSVLALTESIMPIDRVLTSEYLSQFNDEGVLSWNDQPWMVADQVGNHLMFVYNKRYITEPPETISEMISMLTELASRPEVTYGLTWNYTEPFFFLPFLTGYGGWVMDEDGRPSLNTEATVKAIRLILDLRDKYRVIPGTTDYDTAEATFKEQRVAAIINGPWSWTGYEQVGIDYGLSRIPMNDETGLWSAPVISSKGYCVNANVPDEKLPFVRRVLEYLTSAEMQAAMAAELTTIPVMTSVRESEVMNENPRLKQSLAQIEVSRPMPIDPKMRQIWDGMRGPYQLVMNGAVSPEEGARLMQREVEKRIADTFL